MLHTALRKIRIFHNLKQCELSKKLEISSSHISEIESNKAKPSLELIEKYSELFGYHLFCLFAFAEWLETKDEKAYGIIALFEPELKAIMDFIKSSARKE